ncbi:protein tyrosine phosphatase [Kocuria tytonicola]|uniref:protein-tyrosine-phosphatase n=1 Tax=Kocuria tytonicola TaxID=2055946 RepID=A0A3L9LY16_9MICC|nr:low molecular weight protein-tyrosine-phosphatase [Kocuria tytonicola]RLY95147.1 low molecular weight phosphotyrosine protein phosphatase [Kocuria tytonicola]RLZ03984.1 protein tyrosine phosphatase [Kocuria tytonicola]
MVDIVTVCTGNICRSPMAEALLRAEVERAGLADRVRVSSAGVSDEEHGRPVDPRAQSVLTRNGLELPEHSAHRITDEELADADLLLAMTDSHRRQLLQRLNSADAGKVRMMRSFDPEATGTGEDLDIADPWYGGSEDFATAWEQIRAATPGLVAWLQERVTTR